MKRGSCPGVFPPPAPADFFFSSAGGVCFFFFFFFFSTSAHASRRSLGRRQFFSSLLPVNTLTFPLAGAQFRKSSSFLSTSPHQRGCALGWKRTRLVQNRKHFFPCATITFSSSPPPYFFLFPFSSSVVLFLLLFPPVKVSVENLRSGLLFIRLSALRQNPLPPFFLSFPEKAPPSFSLCLDAGKFFFSPF